MKPASRSTFIRQHISGWDDPTSRAGLTMLRILGIAALLLRIAMTGLHP